MNFLRYLRVNYFRGVQPLFPDGIKMLIYGVLPLFGYMVAVGFVAFDCMPVLFLSVCSFFVPLVYGLQAEVRPSQYCLYPLSPKRKTVYEYFGAAVYAVVMSAAVFLYLLAFYGVIILIFKGHGWVYLNSFMFSVSKLDVHGILMTAGLIVYSFGSGCLAVAIKKRRLLYLIAFLTVSVVISVLLFIYGIVSVGGEEFESFSIFTIGSMPLNWLYLTYLFVAGAATLAISAILKLNHTKKSLSY